MSLLAAGTSGQVLGTKTEGGCISVAGKSPVVTASGRLSVHVFPGPPNYENIGRGDAAERTLILWLSSSICLDDGNQFANPKVRFDRIHISSADRALMKVLHGAIGKNVTVTGDGFAAESGHHHAPLVILATKVVVQ